MKSGEVLSKSHDKALNVIKSLTTVLENRLYGRLDRREYSYSVLRKRLETILDKTSDTDEFKDDFNPNYTIFDLDEAETGILEDSEGVYKLHLISNEVVRKDVYWGERVKQKHREIVMGPNRAKITEYVQTRTTPHPDRIPFRSTIVTDAEHTESELGIDTALELIEKLDTRAKLVESIA